MHLHIKVFFGRKEYKDRKAEGKRLASLFILMNNACGDCDMPALEVPSPFFVQGCISVCGDAHYLKMLVHDCPCSPLSVYQLQS